MSDGPEQRWSPFPVQDWSTLPHDPLAPAAPPTATGRVRPWWIPLVVLLCLGLATGTGTWLARRAPETRTPALVYVPADGDADWQRVDVTREAATQSSVDVTESTRFAGINGLISASPFFTTRVLHQDYDQDPSGARLWRTVTTHLDEVGVSTQTMRYYRVRGSVELAGEQSPDGITAYEPALLELPADVGPGSTWSSSGSVGAKHDYTSRLHAEMGQGAQAGCLVVSGELDVRAKGSPQAGSRTSVSRTWCAGRGIVDASESVGDVRTVQTSVAAPAPGVRDTAAESIRWSGPARWAPRTWDTLCVDPGVSDDPQALTDGVKTEHMYGTAETAITPVLAKNGLVVRASSLPQDLVAVTPKTVDAWTPAWSVHPGGTILSLAAFGEVVLVTTSGRRLVAYSDAGVRLWERDLAELGPTPAVRVSDSDAVVVDLAGRVQRFAIADGSVRWEHPLGSDVNASPVVGAGVVVVADRGGTVSALDADTGTVRWDRSSESTRVAVVDDVALLVQDQDVVGIDAAAGTTRYVRHFDGQATALTGFAGRALVVSKTASAVLGPDGTVAATLPGYLAVDVTDDHAVGWTADRMDVVDLGGRVVASWPTPSTSLVSSDRPGLPTPQGVYLFGYSKEWSFGSWTTGG